MADKEQELIATIISGEPATKDAFNGGGHNRSAKALVDTIKQLADRDGAIGLEGNWGTGKTTVVGFAEAQLKKADKKHNYKVFTFDLWSHQSDDFRRAFLEEFVSWIEGEKLLEPKDIKDARDKIRDRVKIVETRNTSRYSLAGLVIFLALPLLPILYSWLGLPDIIVWATDGSWHIDWVWRKILAITTFIFGYILVLGWTWQQFKQSKAGASKDAMLEAFSKAVDLFQRRAEKDKTTQNIRDEDPTTIEFYNIFRNDLLAKIQKDKCRIVFVLDNIDRLPSDRVRDTWAEVRSIFSNSPMNTPDVGAWVTAVVPYDRSVIEKTIEDNHADDKMQMMSAQLISKTFDRVIRVSPPIGTDWKEYFFDQFRKNIKPTLDDDTLHRLYKLLDIKLLNTNQRPTPRHVISYINEFGALWVQWGNELHPESLALWVLTREFFEGDPNKLLNHANMQERYTAVANIDAWQNELAALAFNVPLDKAEELLFSQPLERALLGGDSSVLEEISENSAFPDKLEDVLNNRLNDWAAQGAGVLSSVARNLNAVILHSAIERTTWTQLARATIRLTEVEYKNAKLVDDLALIISRQTNAETAKSVARDIYGRFLQQAVDENWDANIEVGRKWLTAVTSIFNAVAQVSDLAAKSFLRSCNVSTNDRFCVAVAVACSNSTEIDYSAFKNSPRPQNFAAALDSLLLEYPEYFAAALREIYPLKNAIGTEDITTFLATIGAKLRTPKLGDDDSAALVDALHFLWSQKKEACSAVLKKLVGDGTLIYHAHKLDAAGKAEASSSCVFLMIASLASPKPPAPAPAHPQLGDITKQIAWYRKFIEGTETSPQVVAMFAKLIAKHDQFSEWMDYALKEASGSSFYKQVFRQMVKDSVFNRIHVSSIVSSYPEIKNVLGPDLTEKLLTKYEDWGNHFVESFKDHKSHSIPSYFIHDVSRRAKSSKLHLILDCVDEHLSGLTKADWEAAIKAPSDDRLRLASLRPESISGTGYKEAVGDLLCKVMEGENLGFEDADGYIVSFLKAAKPVTKKAIAKFVLNKLEHLALTSTGVENFVRFYGDVAEKMDFTQNPDSSVFLLSNLLESSNANVQAFIKAKSSQLSKCLKKATGDNVGLINAGIEHLLGSEEDTKRLWGEALLKDLGLPKPKNKA